MADRAETDVVDVLTKRYPCLIPCRESILDAIMELRLCYQNGGKLLVCGNGGSAADALHIVGELMKAFASPRAIPEKDQELFASLPHGDYIKTTLQKALPAIALVTETSLMTAFINDVAYDLVFAQQVYGYGRKGDVLLGITTSGNSKNIVYAMETAKALGMRTISLTGAARGQVHELSDVSIQAPETETYQVQELHLPIYHAICLALELAFFKEE